VKPEIIPMGQFNAELCQFRLLEQFSGEKLFFLNCCILTKFSLISRVVAISILYLSNQSQMNSFAVSQKIWGLSLS
jgi:hypothetical protein